jgi:hypothetical protein
MNTVSESLDHVRRTVDLEAELHRAGFRPGVPPHLTLWAKTVDQGICRDADCSVCGNHGLLYRPHFNGSAYRVIASCPCGYSEEM